MGYLHKYQSAILICHVLVIVPFCILGLLKRGFVSGMGHYLPKALKMAQTGQIIYLRLRFTITGHMKVSW